MKQFKDIRMMENPEEIIDTIKKDSVIIEDMFDKLIPSNNCATYGEILTIINEFKKYVKEYKYFEQQYYADKFLALSDKCIEFAQDINKKVYILKSLYNQKLDILKKNIISECLNIVHNTECEFNRKQSLILFVSDELDSIKEDLINTLQLSEDFILKQDSNIPNVFEYSYKIGDVEYSILLILCKPTEVKSYLSGTHLYDMTLLDNYTHDKSWVQQAKDIACCDKVRTVSLR